MVEMSPAYDMLHMGGNSTISKLCTPCMFEVEVYINFGCTAHRELKAFFMMVARSSVIILFEFFYVILSALQSHCVHLQPSVSSFFCSNEQVEQQNVKSLILVFPLQFPSFIQNPLLGLVTWPVVKDSVVSFVPNPLPEGLVSVSRYLSF